MIIDLTLPLPVIQPEICPLYGETAVHPARHLVLAPEHPHRLPVLAPPAQRFLSLSSQKITNPFSLPESFCEIIYFPLVRWTLFSAILTLDEITVSAVNFLPHWWPHLLYGFTGFIVLSSESLDCC